MAIDKKTVENIAHLSRLFLCEGESHGLAKELDDILSYMGTLNKLDVSSVEPMSHVLALKNVYREDMPKESLPVDEALKNAPQKEGDSFRVPRVI